MGLEQNNEQHYREVVDKYHDPAATYIMTVRDYVLRPTVVADPITITLPQVSEAKGRFYSIISRGNVDTTNTVTIANNGESENWIGDIVLSELGDGVILYSDGLAWSGHPFSDHVGLLISPDAQITTGVHISGLTNAALHISGIWGTTLNTAAILIADDAAGTALALGTVAESVIIERVNATAEITGGNYIMGKYMTLATSETFGATGFLIGHYIRIDCAHVVQDSYAIWGKCAISGAQPGDTSNQHVGVFGSMTIDGVACALAATGGCYAVLGVASIASGGTLDQPLIAGYFDAGAVDNITGAVIGVKAIMRNYCDYGFEAHCYTNNNIAGIHLIATNAAKMGSGIKFEASAVGGQGYIHHAFRFLDADMSDGAYVQTTTITDADSAEGVIKIDCNGTHYYIPFYDASVIDTEWADQ